MGQPTTMTVEGVALYLSVHPNTIYRLARRGAIPAFKVGSSWRFNRASIDCWRREREGQPVAEDSSASELLHILHWYVSTVAKTWVTLADLRLFSDRTQDALAQVIEPLVAEGLVAQTGATPRTKLFCLTPRGREQSARRFAAGPTGHASVIELAKRWDTQRAAANKDDENGVA